MYKHFAVLFFLGLSHVVIGQHFSEEIDISKSINYPETAEVVDIDDDGDQDVFCTSIGDGKVSFFENVGNGQFAEMQIISYAARSSSQLYFEDLNADGKIDLISTSSDLDGVFWMENLGGGEFGPEQVIESFYSSISSIKIQDIDSDDDLDLMVFSVFSSSSSLETFINNGTGSFSLLEQFTDFEEHIALVESADLNGDGHADLFLNNTLEDIFIFLPNNGNGTFGQRDTTQTDFSLGHTIELFDMDNDGDLDIFTGQFVNPGTLLWYENDGLGSFSIPIPIQEGFNNIKDIEPGDFDNDGDIDFVILATDIKYLENLGSGSYAPLSFIDEELIGLEKISSGDITGNGNLDIVVASHGLGWEDFLTRFENSGDANFGSAIHFNPQDPDGVHASDTGDIDGDGDIDFVCATLHNDLVIWYENNGSAAFSEGHITSVEENQGYRHIELADLDGDGDLDIITGSSSDNHVAWQENDGNGNFSSMQTLTDDADYPYNFVVNDLDGDGDMDICIAAFDDGEVLWFKNDGNQNFDNGSILSEDSFQTRQVGLADLNEDGLIDIVSCSFGTHGLVWYPANGNGEFEEAEIILQNTDVKAFVLNDFNYDGHIDILYEGVSLLLNDGTGSFDLESSPSLFWSPNNLITMDIDTDGDEDVLSAGGGGIQYTFNQIANGFSDAQNIRNHSASFVELNKADFDNDGDEDLMYVDIFSDRVALLMNQSSSGCTDPDACNFDSNASEDDGSCCYTDCGCTNSSASNYNPLASCDDGSCIFSVEGLVYFDENNNGLFDDLDYGLANQEVHIDPAGISILSNNDGAFILELNEEEELTFSHQEDNDFPFYTSPSQITVNTDSINWNSDTLFFGISNTVPFYELDVNMYPASNVCIDVNPYWLSISNDGNAPLEAVIEFEKDELLNLVSSSLPIDSVDGNFCYFTYPDLLPGQNAGISFLFEVISADNIGDTLFSSVNVDGYYNESIVAGGMDLDEEIIACSYDPNDKQVFPEGYGDAHWVQKDSLLEYMIRFQNTGNAPAQNVWIRDTLDVNLDVSSFEFLSSSHSVHTSLDSDTRELLFFFEDIMLPDSVNNEAESHGYVRFAIRNVFNAPLLTEINNTAAIFFDSNEPIITNTTWSTLYDCSLFEASFAHELGILTASDGDNFQWFFNGEEVADETGQISFVTEEGFYSVMVGIDFPCSALSEEVYLGISDVSYLTSSGYKLYPNPADEFTIVSFEKSSKIKQVSLYDINGRLIETKKYQNENTVRFDLEGLSKGTYIIRIVSDSTSVSAKLVKE
ncbi:MAG: FG-GAP-like repeat-containing protein [Bacteroidota bacterium]